MSGCVAIYAQCKHSDKEADEDHCNRFEDSQSQYSAQSLYKEKGCHQEDRQVGYVGQAATFATTKSPADEGNCQQEAEHEEEHNITYFVRPLSYLPLYQPGIALGTPQNRPKSTSPQLR